MSLILPFITSLLLLLSMWLLWHGFSHLRKRHLIRGTNECSLGVAGVTVGVSFFFLSINLYQYQALTEEQFVGLVEVKQVVTGFELTFKRPEKKQVFQLQGDEWQIDSQILKWEGPAYLFGLTSMYRLERISSRYRSIEKAKNTLPNIFSLVEKEQVDLWQWLNDHNEWLPWVDAVYGNSVYMPLVDGIRYEVSMGFTGLIARPLN